MKIRAIVVAMLVALLTLAASAVNAQEACLGLSDEDCTAITEATNTTASATSFYQTFSLDFSITGVPGGDISLTATGEGPVAISGSAAFPFNLSSTIEASATNPDGTESNLSTEVRVVDGILYFQDPETSEWGGVELQQIMDNPQMLGLPVNPADFADPTAMGVDQEALMTAMLSLGELAQTPGFLTDVRDGDTYMFTADFGVLLQSPDYSKAAASLSQAFASNPQMAQAAAFLPALPMLLSEGKVVVTRTVDPELNALTGLTLDISGVLNTGAMGGDTSAAPININFTLDIALSDLNGDFTFEAPADAQMAPTGN